MQFGIVLELEKRNILRYWATLYLHLGPFYNNLKILHKKLHFLPKNKSYHCYSRRYCHEIWQNFSSLIDKNFDISQCFLLLFADRLQPFCLKHYIFCPKISHIIAIPEVIVMKFGRMLALS